MRTISIQRPWPEAIFRGEKTIECRSWQTKYRGILAIHVALKKWCYHWPDSYYKVKGAIVGTVELVEIVKYDNEWDFYQFHENHLLSPRNWTRYGWVFENPVRFATPIPYKGRLGLWESPRHADLCKYAEAFEEDLLSDTHACFVDVKPSDKSPTWREGLNDVRMINADEGYCDDCERWEAEK